MKVRNRFDRMRVITVLETPDDKLLTQQQFKEECDMNRIVERAMKGIPPRFLAKGTPRYGDFSNVPDLQGAYDLIGRAHEAFMALPAALRKELGNDPAQLQHITSDQVERYKLGKPKEEVVTPPPTPTPSQPAPGSSTPNPAPAGG